MPGGKKELETDSRIVVDHRDGWLRRNNLAEHNRAPVGRAPEVRWHSRRDRNIVGVAGLRTSLRRERHWSNEGTKDTRPVSYAC